jgi:acetoin utilization deacetylase AcuC-like enzyme
MSRLRVYYRSEYAPTHPFVFARLRTLADSLAPCAHVEIRAPEPIDPALLRGLHADDYLDAFLHGRNPLASSQGLAWTPAVRDATLAMLGGQLEAAQHALQHGVAMNIARGFHHACWARGGGFCALNGLALLAYRLPQKRIFVVDCDEHGGDGTEDFCARLPNLYNASVFGTRYGYVGGPRAWAFPVDVRRDGYAVYAAALDAIRELLIAQRPDLLVYQAGVDCHRDDRKGRAGLSTRQLFQRDRRVFTMARELGLPVVFVVAGGYQDARILARLNRNTVRAAVGVFQCPVP